MGRPNPYFRFRELRIAAGIRQTALSKRLGYAPSVVSQWENSGAIPSATQLPKIAHALGCSVEELYWPEVLRAAKGGG